MSERWKIQTIKGYNLLNICDPHKKLEIFTVPLGGWVGLFIGSIRLRFRKILFLPQQNQSISQLRNGQPPAANHNRGVFLDWKWLWQSSPLKFSRETLTTNRKHDFKVINHIQEDTNTQTQHYITHIEYLAKCLWPSAKRRLALGRPLCGLGLCRVLNSMLTGPLR